MKENNVVVFEDGEIKLAVNFDEMAETFWLTQNQIASLYGKGRTTITGHISNIFKENELEMESNVGFSDIANSDKPVKIYSLDVVMSVGYRVKSSKGILFRKWATKIIKEFAIKGIVYNNERLKQLERMQEIQVEMIEGVKGFDASEVLNVLSLYAQGLKLLDDFDHQALFEKKNLENRCIYTLNYEECMDVIEQSPFEARGDLFGKKRDESFQSSIDQIYQSYGGVELYPTLEDEAVNLLYFITKNHGFYDGNKRIAATIFLYFLMKNRKLIVNNRQRISNTTLATLTVLIAESKPEDRENILAFSKELIQLSISV